MKTVTFEMPITDPVLVENLRSLSDEELQWICEEMAAKLNEDLRQRREVRLAQKLSGHF